jgi:hypothetical protein
MENKKLKTDLSFFNAVKLECFNEGRSIRQTVNMYRNSISNIMKNFTISDGEKIIKQAPRAPQHRPTTMNMFVNGMKRYIFGSNGLFKIKNPEEKANKQNKPNTKNKTFKYKKSNPNTNPKLTIHSNIFEKRIDEKPSMFITDVRSHKSRNQLPSLRMDSNSITNYTSNSQFLKTFSSKKFSQQCCDIWKDNIELYNNFIHTSRTISYPRERKRKEYESDIRILGKIDKQYERHEMIRNTSTGRTEFIDKRKVDLMKFGSNLDKIRDEYVLGYKKNIEEGYRNIARQADVDDLCTRIKVNQNFRKLNKNDFKIKHLKILLSRKKLK